MSECTSSRVVKTSAVDLLDSVMTDSNYYSTKTQSKFSPSNNHSSVSQSYATNNNNGSSNGKNVDFGEFSFWTSTVGGNKNEGENRPKSNSQTSKNTSGSYSSNNYGGSPPTPKNNYYQQSVTAVSNDNQLRPRHSTTVASNGLDFDMFVGAPSDSKKSSPYLKK